MGSQNFTQSIVGPGTPGWDAIVSDNAARLETWLSGQPFCVKRFYRVSGSNASAPQTLSLVNFPAASFEGAVVFLKDPEGAEGPFAYSNGTNWKYLLTGNNLTGIA